MLKKSLNLINSPFKTDEDNSDDEELLVEFNEPPKVKKIPASKKKKL